MKLTGQPLPDGLPKDTREARLGGKNGFTLFYGGAHRFTTDSVLLAYFAGGKPGLRVCDLGAGCGIIAFLLTLRGAHVTAVEFDPAACRLMEHTIAVNRLTVPVVEADLRAGLPVPAVGVFDLVVCNPPYFSRREGRQSPDPVRDAARGDTGCTPADAVKAAARLLTGSGRLCMCIPPRRLAGLFAAMESAGIRPKRLWPVQSSVVRPPKLLLIEGQKGAREGLLYLPPLITREGNGESAALREIYQSWEN